MRIFKHINGIMYFAAQCTLQREWPSLLLGENA